MTDVQEWLEQNYPKYGVCIRENELVDKDKYNNNGKILINNKGKKRNQILICH